MAQFLFTSQTDQKKNIKKGRKSNWKKDNQKNLEIVKKEGEVAKENQSR